MELLEMVNPKALLIAALVFIPLERLLPFHREQKFLRAQLGNDLIYALVNKIFIKIGLLLIFAAVLSPMIHLVPMSLRETISGSPLWLQVLGVLLVADTGFYAAHRAFHAIPFLWKFHKIHHSIEELDWLAAHRVHPIDQTLTQAASLVPVFLLGFSGEAIVIFALIYQWQSLLIHSNVHMPFGIFRWVLASPQYHHWHHGNQPEAYDKNFAGQLPIIDLIFGTAHFPKDRVPERYGLDEPIPKYFHEQLIFPFLPDRAAAGETQANETEKTKDLKEELEPNEQT